LETDVLDKHHVRSGEMGRVGWVPPLRPGAWGSGGGPPPGGPTPGDLKLHDVLSLQALGTLRDREFHGLAFCK
jgi:hypothetical protein